MDIKALPLLFELIAKCFDDEWGADDQLTMTVPLLHFFYSALTKKGSEGYSNKSDRCSKLLYLSSN